MAERKRNPGGWAACKRALAEWPLTGVLGLLRELYDLSPENRAFLQARLLPREAAGKAAGAVERRLRGMASRSAVCGGSFRHVDMKRVVDQFAKGTDDPALVAQVLISDLESSCATFEAVGDFPPLVDHLLAVITRLYKLLPTVPRPRLAPLAERLARLADAYRLSFGYGVSDEPGGLADSWTARASDVQAMFDGDENPAPPRPEPDF
jgi:hypothetical protein